MEPKDVLVRQIGDLLGFEDGAEDMLDHVLTIDSSEVRYAPTEHLDDMARPTHSRVTLPSRNYWIT